MSNLIKMVVDSSFRSHGFNKTGSTWYKDCPESTLVANLQKSQYGDSYYLNLGVWLKALGESLAPKEHQCHIRLRLNNMVGKSLDQALNMENAELGENDRRQIIAAAVENEAIPWLISCASTDGIRAQFEAGLLSKAMINKRVKEFIGNI
jgi:hypothetical protein